MTRILVHWRARTKASCVQMMAVTAKVVAEESTVTVAAMAEEIKISRREDKLKIPFAPKGIFVF